MTSDGPDLLQQPEGEQVEKKSLLDPTSSEDFLGLVADLTAMANTSGGSVVIGTAGTPIPSTHIKLFDSARVDDKVNSFVEPRIGGITSEQVDSDFIVVHVEKSQNPPHVFKKEGNFQHEKKGQMALFRAGDVFARHSSKSERANRADYDRWYEEYRVRLFDNVRMVFEAGPSAQIQIAETAAGGAVPVRIDPDAPGAQPVFDLLTPEPFRDLQQELTGGVKAWKTSRQLLNEGQIVKAYRQKHEIADPEILELLLRSCWEHRLPGYYWAGKVPFANLYSMLEDTIRSDPYPATAEALKVASLLPRELAKPLLAHADDTTRSSVENLQTKLEPVLRARARRHITLAKLLHPSKRLKYRLAAGVQETRIEALNEQAFEDILGTLPAQLKENRAPFRLAELVAYGSLLSELQMGEAVAAIEGEAEIIQEAVPQEPSAGAELLSSPPPPKSI